MKKAILFIFITSASIFNKAAFGQQMTATFKGGEKINYKILEIDPHKAPNMYVGGGIFFGMRPLSFASFGVNIDGVYHLAEHASFFGSFQTSVGTYFDAIKEANLNAGDNGELSYTKNTPASYSVIELSGAYYFMDKDIEKERRIVLKSTLSGRVQTNYVVKTPMKKRRQIGLKVGILFCKNSLNESLSINEDTLVAASGEKLVPDFGGQPGHYVTNMHTTIFSIGGVMRTTMRCDMDIEGYGLRRAKGEGLLYFDLLFGSTSIDNIEIDPATNPVLAAAYPKSYDVTNSFDISNMGFRFGYAPRGGMSESLGYGYALELGSMPGVKVPDVVRADGTSPFGNIFFMIRYSLYFMK